MTTPRLQDANNVTAGVDGNRRRRPKRRGTAHPINLLRFSSLAHAQCLANGLASLCPLDALPPAPPLLLTEKSRTARSAPQLASVIASSASTSSSSLSSSGSVSSTIPANPKYSDDALGESDRGDPRGSKRATRATE